MIITKKQLGILSEYMQSSFEKKAITHLRKKFPSSTKTKTEKELLQLIREGIGKAETFDITERQDVLPFLEYILCLGNDFEKDAAHFPLKKILKSVNLTGAEKIARMDKENSLLPET